MYNYTPDGNDYSIVVFYWQCSLHNWLELCITWRAQLFSCMYQASTRDTAEVHIHGKWSSRCVESTDGPRHEKHIRHENRDPWQQDSPRW